MKRIPRQVQDPPRTRATSLNVAFDKADDEAQDMNKVASVHASCAWLALEVERTQSQLSHCLFISLSEFWYSIR